MAKRSKKTTRAASRAPVRKPASSASSFPGPGWTRFFQAVLIAVASLWAFWPSVHGGWLWDDDFYVTQNVLLHDPDWLWKIWSAPGSVVNYFPITATVQWAQWQIWGLDTFGYHLTNILLHGVNALLVWRLLAKFHLRFAWLGGLIFAVHPTGVESVAWISELKNTLSLSPFLLAACAYIDFDESKRGRDYVLAFGWFVVAMLAKVTMVAFPFVILLYAWWKRGKIGWPDIKASLPFLVIAIGLGLLNVLVLGWYQASHGVHETIPMGGLGARLARIGLAFSFYFSQAILPWSLSPMYPLWKVDPPHALQFLPWVVFAAVFYGLWLKRQTWGRHVMLGLGFFLLNLAPFAGFFWTSFMRFTWVMDHFLYLPIIGLIALVVAALGQIDACLTVTQRRLLFSAVALALVLLAIQCRSYSAVFRSSDALWTYTTQRYPDAWLAWDNLGGVQFQNGNSAAAIESYQRSLALQPDNASAHYNLGVVLAAVGHSQEALEQYRQALAINPSDTGSHLNMGNLFIQAGRLQDAMEQYRQAVQSDPSSTAAHNDLGNTLRQSGHLPEAIDQYREALRLDPDYVQAHDNLAVALNQVGQFPEAIEQCRQALKIKPEDTEALNNWAIVLANTGHFSGAEEQLHAVLQIDPQNAQARENFAKLQAREKSGGAGKPH